MPAPHPARAALAGLKEHLIALSDDVHRLSRQLHPAILDDLGLKDALRAECDRVAERGRLAVNFRCGQLPAGVPRDLALCVYRMAQEALRNAVKHAQADRVDLTLNADLEFLDLEVRDFGRGFDPGRGPAERASGWPAWKNACASWAVRFRFLPVQAREPASKSASRGRRRVGRIANPSHNTTQYCR